MIKMLSAGINMLSQSLSSLPGQNTRGLQLEGEVCLGSCFKVSVLAWWAPRWEGCTWRKAMSLTAARKQTEEEAWEGDTASQPRPRTLSPAGRLLTAHLATAPHGPVFFPKPVSTRGLVGASRYMLEHMLR